MTSFYALPDASQNAQSQARQADIQKAVEEAQRAVEAATREAVAAQQQAQAAAEEAAQRGAQERSAPGNGVIVFPGEGGNPDVRVTVDGRGIHVSQNGNNTTIPIQDVVPRGAVQITYALSAALIAVAIVGPLLRFFLRRFERRQVTAQLNAGVQARLDAMERNIDTVAVELERVSEGQRFTNRLLEQRPLEYAQRPDR